MGAICTVAPEVRFAKFVEQIVGTMELQSEGLKHNPT